MVLSAVRVLVVTHMRCASAVDDPSPLERHLLLIRGESHLNSCTGVFFLAAWLRAAISFASSLSSLLVVGTLSFLASSLRPAVLNHVAGFATVVALAIISLPCRCLPGKRRLPGEQCASGAILLAFGKKQAILVKCLELEHELISCPIGLGYQCTHSHEGFV